MQGSEPLASSQADTSEVVTEESHVAPEATRLPDEQPAPQEVTPPVQDTPPPADDPAKPPEPDAAARRNDPVKRIDKLTRKLRDAERETAYLKGRLEAQEEARVRADKPKTPRLDDYDSAEEFAEALAEHYVAHPEERPGHKARREQEAPRQPQREAPDEPDAATRETAVKSYVAAKAKFPDLDDVLLDETLPFTKSMADALAEEEDSAEILYNLGLDETELARIAGLSPRQQTREVWRFAEKYRAGQSAPPPPGDPDQGADQARVVPQAKEQPRAVVSKAAPVPPSLSGSGQASKRLEDMSQEEYEAHMNQKDRARRN